MPLPLLDVTQILAHPRGSALAFGGLLLFKFAKLTIVCWRRQVINREVRRLTDGRAQIFQKDEDGDTCSSLVYKPRHKESTGAASSFCCECKAPGWLRREETEALVQLHECGCVMHSCCLLEVAERQHGLTLPSISDPAHAFVLLRRLFGIDAIIVDQISCPACGITSSSWATIAETRTVLPLTASRPDVLASLRRGEALCLGALRSMLLEARETHLGCWRNAAQHGELQLKKLLTDRDETERDGTDELLELLCPPKVDTVKLFFPTGSLSSQPLVTVSHKACFDFL
eukprot:TRINITY_DN93834_c0_g1_i1.p1 TRINITY_DN93834_c0_g1~~TRINITY_DN93834_c0_g1_i1.p1  ORF type:complete len:287 (+),score=44.19 TRINITY_DN93834_c0_g1_i1:96-956(+)